MSLGAETDRRDLALGAALGVAETTWLFTTERSVGFTRDEGFYVHAAAAYGRWLRLLAEDPARATERASIDAAFAVNHEHPPLLKLLFAASRELLADAAWMPAPGAAVRLPAMLLAGLLVALVYLWGARAAGRAGGLFAAIGLAVMPRVFFHAHLACFDVPITALFFATCFAFARAQDGDGLGWPLATAALFGLSLASKHNAWILPPLFACHVAARALGGAIGGASPIAAAHRGAATLGLCLVLGPALALALWPWLWFDTLARVQEYVAFHVHHEFYNMAFLGRTYHEPPFPRAYAPVMTAATVPTTTLSLAAIGVWAKGRDVARALRRRDAWSIAGERDAVLWLGAVLASYGPWTSSSTPIFGGTKHWMTAYPFLALFAGVGFARVAARLARTSPSLARRSGELSSVAAGALALLLVAPGLATSSRAHPWGLSCYVPLLGGAPGAATLGLNRTFWGYTTASLAGFLNAEAPRGARVYAHDTLGLSWDQMVLDGTLRRDLVRVGSVAEADLALYHHEPHMRAEEAQAWVALGTVRPSAVAGPDGVPVVWVHRRAPREAGGRGAPR